MLANANAQPTLAYMPPMGGMGGGHWEGQCGPTEFLMGFELRVGINVDAIRPICVVNYGATAASTAIGKQVVAPIWSGGTGGHVERLVCPVSAPSVIALAVNWSYANDDADNGVDVIHNIHLYCGQALPSQAVPAYPSAVFDTPGHPFPEDTVNANTKWIDNTQNLNRKWIDSIHERCPAGQMAVGVHGRAGKWLDALGLICGAPRRDTSGLALGKVPAAPSGTPIPICEAAKTARARNSPAAASLEAQCNASKGPAVALGKVPISPGSSVPVPVCDLAQSARARNSPAAPSLEAQCRATTGQSLAAERTPDQLAAAGKIIANADPLSAELRRRQTLAPGQRGFDIGMAAAEGQTEWGPGKQKIFASLNPGEQEGFKVAISFSLDRNRNPGLAATGASIAKTDNIIASARTLDPDVRAWLGFDIASGLFGDPAKGGGGSTATGPGSMKIRNDLSTPGQRGFDASMKLHFSRRYKAAK